MSLRDKAVTHNWPRSDETGVIKTGAPTQEYRSGHQRTYGGSPDHINAACCECRRCRIRRNGVMPGEKDENGNISMFGVPSEENMRVRNAFWSRFHGV